MAHLPPLAGWPDAISPIRDPEDTHRRKHRPLRGGGRKRHLRSIKDLTFIKSEREGWHG